MEAEVKQYKEARTPKAKKEQSSPYNKTPPKKEKKEKKC
jgi:hypothetical protein